MESPEGPGDRLDLLLADAEERCPVLDGGLPDTAARSGPRPRKTAHGDSPDWRRTDADPNDLAAQKWAVIAPEGREGDRLLEAITPLVRLRETEQGARAKVYRVPAEMDGRQAVAWKDEVYWAEDVPEDERPLYLMMLGDLHHNSLELQHSLANAALVGRIHFADTGGETALDDYAAYAAKVARLARGGTAGALPDMVFYVAQDGSSATRTGESKLVAPSALAVKEGREKGQFPVADVREVEAETADELLASCAAARPSVLLSVSHGLGPPRRGFRSEEEQQRRQGALLVGQNEVLDAERMRGQRFLPGGLWFYLACFGAGTPSASAYHAWLSLLAKEGAHAGKVDAVLRSLPPAGQRPFVAAMPQAALASPEGPLGVIGHMDLAWTYGFSNAKKLSESRKSRILSTLQVMLRGGRAGVALEALMRFYRETNDTLMSSYQVDADARAHGRPEPTDPAVRGHLWMLRNDLRGYVLLGDPAARLALQQFDPREPLRRSAPAALQGGSAPLEVAAAGGPPAAPAGELLVSAKEGAALALFQGDEAPRAIAARAGVPLETLWAWFDAYRSGGRAQLSGEDSRACPSSERAEQ